MWIILGSGLGGFAAHVENATAIPYEQIPHFPRTTVVGHAGRLVYGTLSGKRVVVQQGRWHTYEGHDAATLVLGVRVMHHLGAKTLLVTNAAGGVNVAFRPGQLMLMTDHINMLGTNPLTGANDARFGPRFPDMSSAYSPDLLDVARQAARALDVPLAEGVYAALRGPSYETPAEIRMLRAIGADAVGMSTVPEVIAASHQGARVLGISVITNMAAGILKQALDHAEVQATADAVGALFTKLLIEIVRLM